MNCPKVPFVFLYIVGVISMKLPLALAFGVGLMAFPACAVPLEIGEADLAGGAKFIGGKNNTKISFRSQ
jgi:hypothetical protein